MVAPAFASICPLARAPAELRDRGVRHAHVGQPRCVVREPPRPPQRGQDHPAMRHHQRRLVPRREQRIEARRDPRLELAERLAGSGGTVVGPPERPRLLVAALLHLAVAVAELLERLLRPAVEPGQPGRFHRPRGGAHQRDAAGVRIKRLAQRLRLPPSEVGQAVLILGGGPARPGMADQQQFHERPSSSRLPPCHRAISSTSTRPSAASITIRKPGCHPA